MSGTRLRYFRVIYYDRATKTYNVSGIITDDTQVTARTVELQKDGREVNIATTAPTPNLEAVPSVAELLSKPPKGYSHDDKLRW